MIVQYPCLVKKAIVHIIVTLEIQNLPIKENFIVTVEFDLSKEKWLVL